MTVEVGDDMKFFVQLNVENSFGDFFILVLKSEYFLFL